ncbi:MAG: ABC transporter ATP-binding protein [Clostridia bacterium]|nr:ABC transporter ATP-binding protein [Clostridia bacterium]
MKGEFEDRRRTTKQSLGKIPDYDYLFEENPSKPKRKKSGVLKALIKSNKGALIGSTLVYFLQAAPTWLLPLITANIINIVTEALASASGVTKDVWIELAINAGILAFFILQNIPSTIWRWRIVSRMSRRISAGVKCSVVRKLQSLSITYHKDMLTGKIQAKFLKDTESCDQLMHVLMFTLIPNIIGIIVASTISICKNGWVSLFFLLVIPVNVILSMTFRKKLRQGFRDYRIKNENMSARLTNMLEMIPVTKSHGLEQSEIQSVNKSIENLANSGIEVDKTNAKFGSSSWTINTVLSAVCLVFCSALALNGIIKVGDIVLYQSMFTQISGYVSTLVNCVPQIGSGAEALSSISEIMNAKDVEIVTGKSHVKDIEGRVDFKNLSYRYPNSEDMVVKNFNLKVEKGECIAVVGSSGSGKTTLMNLIIGFMMPSDGDLLIDGKSVKEFNLSEYRHHISVVPQNSILFPGTIRENITYGLNKYSEKQLEKAVQMANLSELIAELPNGLDTQIGEHGDKLSGGQKQRITIARALIRNPKILILDEATSALDNISEYHVQKAISASIAGRTTFIVAHRLSTIRNADRIVVMENGVAVEIGTYDQLMEKKGKFFELKNLNDLNQKPAELELG